MSDEDDTHDTKPPPEFIGNVIRQLREHWVDRESIRQGVDPESVTRSLIIGNSGDAEVRIGAGSGASGTPRVIAWRFSRASNRSDHCNGAPRGRSTGGFYLHHITRGAAGGSFGGLMTAGRSISMIGRSGRGQASR